MNSGETQPYHAFFERAVARIGYGPTGTRTSTSKISAGSSGKGTGSVVPSGAYLNDLTGATGKGLPGPAGLEEPFGRFLWPVYGGGVSG